MAPVLKDLWKKPAVAAAAYAGLAVADTVLATRTSRKAKLGRYITKPLLMPTLAHSFFHGTEGRSVGRIGVLAGQASSAVGDVALLGRGTNSFLAGIASFGAAHLGYSSAFVSQAHRSNPLTNRGVQAAAAIFAVAGPVNAYAAGRVDPKLRWPVLVYAGVISTMFGASTFLDPELPRKSKAAVLAGTALFVASDAILGAKEFVLKKDAPQVEGAVMATYTAGQGLIALGMADAIRSKR